MSNLTLRQIASEIARRAPGQPEVETAILDYERVRWLPGPWRGLAEKKLAKLIGERGPARGFGLEGEPLIYTLDGAKELVRGRGKAMRSGR